MTRHHHNVTPSAGTRNLAPSGRTWIHLRQPRTPGPGFGRPVIGAASRATLNGSGFFTSVVKLRVQRIAHSMAGRAGRSASSCRSYPGRPTPHVLPPYRLVAEGGRFSTCSIGAIHG